MISKLGDLRNCERCGSSFHSVRVLQRFCSKVCHDLFYIEERRRALADYRRRQALERSTSFFGPTMQPSAEEIDEDNQVRRAGNA